MTQVLRYALVIGSAIGSILLFLLASASDNSGFFDRNYSWLLGLNAAVAGALLILVIVALTRLYARYKAGKFGSDSPMKRPAQPEELAPAYVFLASNADSSYITGTVLQVMGGETTGG